MNSRADPGDGYFRVPPENQTQQEIQFMGSWLPTTPMNSLQGRSSLVVDERAIHQELNGVPSGGFGGVHDLNYAVQGMDQSEVYDHGAHQAVYNGNMSINTFAGSSFAQVKSNGEREDLSGRTSAASPLVALVRNTIHNVKSVNGNFTSEAGVVNGSSFTQSGYGEFELDDLLDTDQISFTSLLSGGDNLFQVPQYGTPACSRLLFNLNSPPRREGVESVCESSFQFVPPTPSLCRTGQENGFLEKITTTTGHENTEEKSDKSMQNIVESSVVNSTEVSKQKEDSREKALGVDLNKIPQQKLSKRKKKFMPKVVMEGKPASQENVKGKETGSGKRKKAQNTNLKSSATKKPAVVGDMSNTSPEITLKSCRKVLSFDLEKTGDARQGDSESEIVQNSSGSNSLSEIRDATGGSCVDSVPQTNQTNGLVATNQPLEEKLPRASQANHPHIPARDQPPELLIGNQQSQFPVVSQMDIHQAWLQMKNELLGFPFGNQRPRMAIRNQQPRLAMGNQQPMYLTGTPRPALASGNQQSRSLQGNKGPMFLNQQTQQTGLPAVNRQCRSPAGMRQLVMSTGGQQHGLLMRNQQSEFLMRNQQHGSSLIGQQPCVPLMNQQPVTQKGFTNLNPMVAACMSSHGLRQHYQSQTPATNLQIESVFRSLYGTAGTCQRSSIPEYRSLQQDIHRNEYIPSQERSNGESFDVCKNVLSQHSYVPTPFTAKLDEARGSKRQYDRAMRQMQNHDLNPVSRWPLLQQIAQSHDVERQNRSAEHLDAAKKMKIQKVVQENLHSMPHEVIEIEDAPTDGARKDKNTASINQTVSKEIPCLVQNSADSGKCVFPKTPAKRGRPPKIKKSVTPPAHASDLQLWEPTLAKTPSSRSKAKEKGRKSKQDPGKARGSSGEFLCQDSIEEIIYRLQNLILGEKIREQNELVLYREDGAIVPYEAKKQKPRPKVDLDDETTRIWNLLMGKGEGDEDKDKKKEKWWEEERRVFRGRADSFIARMHLVQGDRRFSPWKGSVVDSVIGVFLTQNVSDHLSSSAFMSLASRFPPKSSSNREDERNIRSVVVEDPEGCILNLNDSPSWQKKVQHPSDTQVPGVDSGSKEQQKDCSNSGIEIFNFLGNGSQNLEEEVLSSQDSFAPPVFQSCGIIGSCSGSKSDAEFPTTRCETKIVGGSAQSLQTGSPNFSDEICLQGNEKPLLYEGSGDAQTRETAHVAQKRPDLDKAMNWKDSLSFGQPSSGTNWSRERPTNLSRSYEQSKIPQPQVLDIEDFGMEGERVGYSWLSISPRVDKGNKKVPRRVVRQGGNSARKIKGQIILPTPQELPGMGLSTSSSTHQKHCGDSQQCGTQQNEMNIASQLRETYMDLLNSSKECLTGQSSTTQNIMDNLLPRDRAAEDVVDPRSSNISLQNILAESNSSNEEHTKTEYKETNSTIIREMKGTLADGKKPTSQWDSLRQDVEGNGGRKERSKDSTDSIDYEAIRSASISEISEAIKERGMNNMLAVRIKDFLERIAKDHGAVDLEWLRNAPPDKAKDYLLSIRGLGLKSVECVRLLTLHHVAFPVDTNVGRIAVRLGWVPLQPLPESLQLHLLELYPVLESIQKFLWPRLCKLDQPTLYELHYQLITFGKVFCTKSRPNCNACPMRGECRHFASAYASARLALPAPDERSLTSATIPVPPESFPPEAIPMMEVPPPLEKALTRETPSNGRNCEPVIEEPTSPEQEYTEITESDIEDDYYNEDPDDIPSIELNIKQFGMTLREYMERNMELQEGDMSKALVALNPASTSIPTQKLKNISRLRTEHQVYELPDSHPLLHGMEKRDPDEQSPYLLAIWTPGEMADSAQPPEQEWNSVREAKSQTVRGTLLIPVRTGMRGRFPLNGTYFQVNEFFADHESSLKPIDVPRDWIWNLPRRTVYFGTSVTSICRGFSTEQIQHSFWKCFVCVRGFERKIRAPRPLMARLHFPASRLKTTNKDRDKTTKGK